MQMNCCVLQEGEVLLKWPEVDGGGGEMEEPATKGEDEAEEAPTGRHGGQKAQVGRIPGTSLLFVWTSYYIRVNQLLYVGEPVIVCIRMIIIYIFCYLPPLN